MNIRIDVKVHDCELLTSEKQVVADFHKQVMDAIDKSLKKNCKWREFDIDCEITPEEKTNGCYAQEDTGNPCEVR